MSAIKERLYLVDENHMQYVIDVVEYAEVHEQVYIEKAPNGTHFTLVIDVSSPTEQLTYMQNTITPQDARTISEFFGTVSKIVINPLPTPTPWYPTVINGGTSTQPNPRWRDFTGVEAAPVVTNNVDTMEHGTFAPPEIGDNGQPIYRDPPPCFPPKDDEAFRSLTDTMVQNRGISDDEFTAIFGSGTRTSRLFTDRPNKAATPQSYGTNSDAEAIKQGLKEEGV